MIRAVPIVLLFSTAACVSIESASVGDVKTVNRTVPLDPRGSIELDTHNGSIDVRTWDRAEVEISARIEAASSWHDDVRRFEQTTVEISSIGNSVTISSKYPDFAWSWFGGNPRIDYSISTPRSAGLSIRDHNAQVELHDVAGRITVETHNGSVDAAGVAGPLDVNSHNGHVSVDFASFQGATITTHNGSADLALPPASRFDFRADGHHPWIDSDFALLTRVSERRSGSVEGGVNGGGPELRFSSHNGRLRLRQR